MFKAVNKETGQEIVILNSEWDDGIVRLRALDRQDILVCQGCNQPVRVRSGKLRRRHFAHKHLQNCAYSHESPVVLNARAILYTWLVSKFGDTVTLEKKLNNDLLRPIDCWVETQSGNFAYWIIGSGMSPTKRDEIRDGLSTIKAHVHYVFVSDMLREDEDTPGEIHLTTTEREFMKRSDYDAAASDNLHFSGQSLHYLNSEQQVMITYRTLRLVHEPQVFAGQKRESELANLLVSPKNGEFVYSGEYELLKEHNQKVEEMKKRQQEMEQRQKEMEAKYRSSLPIAKPPTSHLPIHTQPTTPNPPINSEPESSSKTMELMQEGTCQFCGKLTRNWWAFDGKTKTCKCRECRDKGIFG